MKGHALLIVWSAAWMRKPKNYIWATIPHQFSNRIAQLHHQRVLQIQLLSQPICCSAFIMCALAGAGERQKRQRSNSSLGFSPRWPLFWVNSPFDYHTAMRRAASNASLVSAHYTAMPCRPPAMLLNPQVVFFPRTLLCCVRGLEWK